MTSFLLRSVSAGRQGTAALLLGLDKNKRFSAAMKWKGKVQPQLPQEPTMYEDDKSLHQQAV
jgi:hypothetical protein